MFLAVALAAGTAEHGLAQERERAAAAPATQSRPAFRSSFEGYRGHADEAPALNWRQVNDIVERLDGHAGHLQGRARPPEPAAAASPPAAAKSQPPRTAEPGR